MDDPEAAIKRLLTLPGVVNWTLHNLRRMDDTRRRLLAFAANPPWHSLEPVNSICALIAMRRLTLEQALDRVETLKHPTTRAAAREIIPRFFSYASENQIEAVPELQGTRISFPIGRGPDERTLTIPVKPTFVAIDGEKLRPYFIVGWASMHYNGYQKQLLSTIITKSLLTQEDYRGSDAQIVCLPRIKRTKVRDVREWPAKLYATLTDEQLNEQFDRYGKALSDVIRVLRGE